MSEMEKLYFPVDKENRWFIRFCLYCAVGLVAIVSPIFPANRLLRRRENQ